MDISIIDLNFDPDHFRSGNTDTTLSFRGSIESTSMNPITMRCVLNADDPIFFMDEHGNRTKEIVWREQLNFNSREYTKETTIRVTGGTSLDTKSQVKITGTTSTGRSNSDFQTITYKR